MGEKKHVKELIVVEGKNDTNRLKLFFDCDTIETGGNRVDQITLDRIRSAANTRGVIVFTDPDSPGEFIRRKIDSLHLDNVKHVFIEKKLARTTKKVGVEHALEADLVDALSHAITFDQRKSTLTWEEFIDLGLVGNAPLREQVCLFFHIGPCNGKTCFKRLNQMGIQGKQIRKYLDEYTNCK